jgi:plastocyanin
MPTNTNDVRIDNRNILDRRKSQAAVAKKKLQILLIIGGLLFLLFLVILIAAIREGGLSNLTKGDKDVVSNTIKNIGTSFTDDNKPTEIVKDFNKPLVLPTQPPSINEVTKSNEQNFIAFDAGLSKYSITIKKGTYVSLTNNTDTPISLKFSDGKVISLRNQESENVTFNKVGTYTFTDTLDNTSSQISGKIVVEN